MEDHNFDENEEEEKIQEKGGVSALDSTLFAILKDLRKKIAKTNNLPPYVIFQDPSLEDMCTNYPITLEELANIQGVGAAGQIFFFFFLLLLISTTTDKPQGKH